MKKTTIGIIIILVAVAVIIIFVWPLFEKLKIAKINIAEKQQQIKELTDYITQLNELAYQINGSETQLAKIDQALSGSSYLPSVFQLMQAASSSSGVKIDQMQLGKEIPLKESKNILGQSINLKASGDYTGLKNFLIALEKSSRLLSIDNVRVMGETTSQDSAKKLPSTIDISFKVFSYYNSQ